MSKNQRAATQTPTAAEQAAAEQAAAEQGLVKMIRDPEYWPAPHSADVHPDEVGNYAAGGWVAQTEE